MNYDEDIGPIILNSARKPHMIAGRRVPPVPDDVILHAYAHGIEVAMNAGRIPPTYIVVGPDQHGIMLYEIGYFEAPDGPDAGRLMICHAMPARLGYQTRYWNAMRR